MEVVIKNITIIRYRSINKMSIDINHDNMLTICGANNVGKTNFLRAVDLFFSKGTSKFDPHTDVPYYIAKGSGGQGYSTKITVKFLYKNELVSITKLYEYKNKNIVLTITGIGKGKRKLTESEINTILDKFQFVFLQSSNINIPELIAKIVNTEILDLGLKNKKGQDKALNKLQEFINISEQMVKSIEDSITNMIRTTTYDIPGIDTKNWKINIGFPAFEKLADAVSGMTEFTVFDTNDYKLDTKGSGIQKIILFSLIRYMSSKKNKIFIWGLDEPEAFLQPSLQKQVMTDLIDISKSDYVFVTTHSNLFVDLNNMEHTYLFLSDNKIVEYARKPGIKFYKAETQIPDLKGYDKVNAIKEHLGIENNDTWELVPETIIVEGEEDRKYISLLAKKLGVRLPMVLPAGGASKEVVLIQYLFYKLDDKFTPKVLCVFDNDTAGKEEKQKLDNKIRNYSKMKIKTDTIVNAEGISKINCEIEDFIYPDLFFKGVNNFLKSKKYNLIKKSDQEKRKNKAYEKMNILDFLNEVVSNNNTDKDRLDFNTESLKKYICELVCKVIEKENLTDMDKKYPEVKKYLQKISDMSEY